MGMKVVVLVLLLINELVAAERCVTCDLEKRITDCENELQICKTSLQGDSNSYLGQVCQWFSNSPKGGRQVLKSTIRNLLKSANLELIIMESTRSHVEVDLKISLTHEDLISLRQFLNNDVGKEEQIQDILSYSISPKGSFGIKKFFSKFSLTRFLQHEGFVITQILCIGFILAFSLWKGIAVWKISVILIVGSVTLTWIRLYKVALSKKQATLQRLGQVPQMCLIEKKGWMNVIGDGFYGLLGIKDNKCEDYYEALMVDPFWEVTPLMAISETFSQFVLKPLEMFGSTLGTFFNDILAPMPFLWKIPVLVIAAVIILLLLLMACRYKIKSPFLFSIEPSTSHRGRKKTILNKFITSKCDQTKEKTDQLNAKTNHIDEDEPHLSNKPLPYPTEPTMIDHLIK